MFFFVHQKKFWWSIRSQRLLGKKRRKSFSKMADFLTENSIFFEILGGTWGKKGPHFGRIWPKNNICWKNFPISFWRFTWRKYPENLSFIPPFAEELSHSAVFSPHIFTACVLAPHELKHIMYPHKRPRLWKRFLGYSICRILPSKMLYRETIETKFLYLKALF